MTTILAVLVVLIVLVAAFLAFVATRPSAFQIERSRSLAAPPELVHAQIEDFRKWPAWSPWEKLDPDMKREHSGAESGRGASYRWAGNSKAGEGRMTITDSRRGRSVTIRLEFLQPMRATNTTVFTLAPSGTGTQLSWTMSGAPGAAANC